MTGLEAARRRRGWTQTVVAYMGGTTQGWVSKYERRRATPGPRVAERLARALGVRPEQLVADVEEPQKERS